MRQKKLLCVMVLGLLGLLAPGMVRAQLTFEINNGSITITGYTGTGGDVVIPSATNGLPVTSIGDYAFDDSTLTNVTIPGSVTNIGSYAFVECTNLASVTMSNGVINIGGGTFQACASPLAM